MSGSGRALTVGLSAAYVSSSRCVRTSSNSAEIDRVAAQRVARLAARDVVLAAPAGDRRADPEIARQRQPAASSRARRAGAIGEIGEHRGVRDPRLRPVVGEPVDAATRPARRRVVSAQPMSARTSAVLPCCRAVETRYSRCTSRPAASTASARVIARTCQRSSSIPSSTPGEPRRRAGPTIRRPSPGAASPSAAPGAGPRLTRGGIRPADGGPRRARALVLRA